MKADSNSKVHENELQIRLGMFDEFTQQCKGFSAVGIVEQKERISREKDSVLP
ncbi:hypothetical protein J6TS1_32400 [Siminovitchia terrae]|uniref:Uncharacterized protein n=1 Tax=Siminovitchia terrae TaxID=1914933 RepID=A0ABQ4KZH3_SIMTE|nr:hypothetical protein J6TS1_32400 [Siminovitchia terrae]